MFLILFCFLIDPFFIFFLILLYFLRSYPSGFRVQGFRVDGVSFRVQGLGLRSWIALPDRDFVKVLKSRKFASQMKSKSALGTGIFLKKKKKKKQQITIKSKSLLANRVKKNTYQNQIKGRLEPELNKIRSKSNRNRHVELGSKLNELSMPIHNFTTEIKTIKLWMVI